MSIYFAVVCGVYILFPPSHLPKSYHAYFPETSGTIIRPGLYDLIISAALKTAATGLT